MSRRYASRPTRDIESGTGAGHHRIERVSQEGVSSDRWWLAAPGDDESLRSLAERADRLYGEPPENVYAWQDDDGHGQLLDAPKSRELLRLARMLGIAPRHLLGHRLTDGPPLLEVSERRAYCPACLLQDNRLKRPRIFRRAWARVLALNCTEHDTPLLWAEPRLSPRSGVEVTPDVSEPTPDELELLRFIGAFASTMDDCLWRNLAWPTGWRGTPQAARALLIRCLTNLTWARAAPPAAQIWLSSSLAPFIAFPLRSVPPLHMAPWEAVRRVGRPAWRRAALWLVAWQVIPELPETLRPETIPSAYLYGTDLWWDNYPPSPHTQRLRNVHASLRRLCAPFPINSLEGPPPRGRRARDRTSGRNSVTR